MEILVQPAGFAVARMPQVGPDGQTADTVTKLLIVDASGIQVSALFATETAWQEFQRYVADPEGETARQQARAQLLDPGGMAPSIRNGGRQK